MSQWRQVQVTRVTPSPTPPPPLPPKQPGGRHGDIIDDFGEEDEEEEEVEAVPVKASFRLPQLFSSKNSLCFAAGHSDTGSNERQRTRREERIQGRTWPVRVAPARAPMLFGH